MAIGHELVNPVDAALARVVAGPVSVPPAGGGADAPRTVSARSLEDVSGVVGAALAPLAVTWLTYGQILPTTGLLGPTWYSKEAA